MWRTCAWLCGGHAHDCAVGMLMTVRVWEEMPGRQSVPSGARGIGDRK